MLLWKMVLVYCITIMFNWLNLDLPFRYIYNPWLVCITHCQYYPKMHLTGLARERVN